MKQVELGFADLATTRGSHIAYPYNDEAERQSTLFSFITTGLRNKEKCITAVSEYHPDFWLQGISERGVDVPSLRDGQLVVLSPSRLFSDTEAGHMRSAGKIIAELVSSSVNEDWNGIRICTGFNYHTYSKQFVLDMLHTEIETDRFMTGKPATVICTFDAGRLHPSLLENLVNCHGFITDGMSIRENTNHNPDNLLASIQPVFKQLVKKGALKEPFASLDFWQDTPVVVAGDEMDLCTSPEVEELAKGVIAWGHRRLIVDLTKTTYLDAAAIGAILRVAKALRDIGGSLVVYDPLVPARKVFQIVRFGEYIPLYPTREEALQAFRMAA